MTTPMEFTVDQTVQFAADQWEATFAGADVFAARASLTSASIASGFLDAGLNPVMVTSIANGIIDEIELHDTKEGASDKMTTVVRGRDSAARAADSVILVSYIVGLNAPPAPPNAFAPGFPQLTRQPGLTEPIIVQVGPSLSARYICQDLASRAGLSCLYQARDYRLLEDFHATGSVLDAIRSLVEPFSHFEPSKVDIWVEGTQLVVRARDIGGGGSALSIFDARLTNLMVRQQQMGRIRVLRLTGGVTIHPRFLNVDPGTPVDDSPFAAGVSEVETITLPDEDTILHDRVVARKTGQQTRRIRDGAVLASHEEQYLETVEEGIVHPLQLVSTLDVVSDWDALEIAYPNRIVNSPKERTQTAITEGRTQVQDPVSHLTTWIWEPQSRVVMSHTYDPSSGFLLSQTKSIEVWDRTTRDWGADPTWETKNYSQNGAGTSQVRTIQHAADGTPGAPQRTVSGGLPPGGPGRRADGRKTAPPPAVQPGDQTPIPGIPVTYAVVIDSGGGRASRDFSLTNPNLLAPDLLVIANQARQASGKRELELTFTAAAIPWLRRGQRLQLTGLEDPSGAGIALQSALVTECRIEYREGQAYLSHVKACWWE